MLNVSSLSVCEVPWGEPLRWLIMVGLTLPLGLITP